ncbi:MAG: phosphatidylserine/phosphatidylglycerophosphate/cardiolipin synthase family protein [Kofleriaceae bacterium]
MRPRPFRAFATRRRARRVKQLRGAGASLGSGLAHVSSPVDGSHPRVLGSGDQAFLAIVDRVARAERSVEIRAFLWRDDEAGNLLGEAVLAAAERGAKVAIHKDRIAAVYEYTGGNKQSFFHKRVDPIRGLQAWLLGAVTRAPGSIRQRPNPLMSRILDHANIHVEHTRKRFDHSKLFIVDDRYLALGSMGIGDNHRHEWIDVMVEAEGDHHVARLRERMNGDDEFDPSRGLDFLVHSREAHRKKSCPMISHRLALIDSAQVSLTVEMAYLGDRRFTAALARAVGRGCAVTLVTAENADVLGATNRATCDLLLRMTGAPENLKVVVLPRMVHSKVVVIDHRFADVGSANFTALSHGVYDEINLYADSEPFARELEAEIERHCENGKVAGGRIAYRKMFSGIEKAVVAYQSRRGG